MLHDESWVESAAGYPLNSRANRRGAAADRPLNGPRF